MSTTAKPRVAVEVAVDSLAGARVAAHAGADRVELCQALELGGLTPSTGLLDAVRRAVGLPVAAMLRPRAGDFLYDDDEFAVVRADLERLLGAGAACIVVGLLTAEGELDLPRLRELVAAAAPVPLCCHRAFDLVREPSRALEQLVDLGVARVLTSGQRRSAEQGAAAIAQLVERAAGRIAVMAGAGVRAANVLDVVRRTGVAEVHLSASRFRASAMRRHGAADVAMATAAPADETVLRYTDRDEVAAVIAALGD